MQHCWWIIWSSASSVQELWMNTVISQHNLAAESSGMTWIVSRRSTIRCFSLVNATVWEIFAAFWVDNVKADWEAHLLIWGVASRFDLVMNMQWSQWLIVLPSLGASQSWCWHWFNSGLTGKWSDGETLLVATIGVTGRSEWGRIQVEECQGS